MKIILSLGRYFMKMTVIAVGLFAAVNPAFAVEINNNSGAVLNVSIKGCSDQPIFIKIRPSQTYGCVAGEQCSGTCTYSIQSSGSKSCSGEIDAGAGAGLQVDPGLSCKPYN